MNFDKLQKFDLNFPSRRIAGTDRDWAFETYHVLRLVEHEFVIAVSSCIEFNTKYEDTLKQFLYKTESKYERCLQSIYARSFVFSLNAVSKLLGALKTHLNPPDAALVLISEYETILGNLKHIRDSIAHIEDRGRGVDKKQNKIPANFLVIDTFVNRCFVYTGNDGKRYGVEISESTLLHAHRILQGIINCYTWE